MRNILEYPITLAEMIAAVDRAIAAELSSEAVGGVDGVALGMVKEFLSAQKPAADGTISHVVKPMPTKSHAPRGPVLKAARLSDVRHQWTLAEDLTIARIRKILQGLEGREGADSKSKWAWDFTVDGQECAIWEWKGGWSGFGPREAFSKLGLAVT